MTTSLPSEGAEALKPSIWPLLLGLLAIALAVFLVYWPGLGGGYIFDDFPNIVENARVHVTHNVWREWMGAAFSSSASDLQRPLAMLSFGLNHYFTGQDPWPMKLTNVCLHAFNALLVFGLVRQLLLACKERFPSILPQSTESAALFAAALWAIHPINFTAVLYVVQRMESLSHTFVFVGLWLYILGRQRQLAGSGGWPQMLLALTLFPALGLLAKESAVLLPVYAFAIEWLVFNFRSAAGGRSRPVLWSFALLLLLPAVVGLAWLLPVVLDPGAYSGRNFTLAERLLTESRVVLDYLRWSLLPNLNQMGLYHDDYVVSRGLLLPASTLTSILGLCGIAACAVLVRQQRPVLSLGLAWFFTAQLLTATVIPLELVFEHRNYFASLGVCLILTDLFFLLPSGQTARFASRLTAFAVLALFAGGTWARAQEWHDPLRFVVAEANKHPQSPRATYEKARTLMILSGYRHDSPYLEPARVALEDARRVPGSSVLPTQAALLLAAHTGQPFRDDWWTDFAEKLEHQPVGPQPLSALGKMVDCANSGDCKFPPGQMLRLFAAALTHGDNAELFNIYGSYVLNTLGDTRLALSLWRDAVRLKPKTAQYRINLTKLLIVVGRHDEARAQIAEIRHLGRLGQNEASAAALEARLARARQ